jgi:hypothetical protein
MHLSKHSDTRPEINVVTNSWRQSVICSFPDSHLLAQRDPGAKHSVVVDNYSVRVRNS